MVFYQVSSFFLLFTVTHYTKTVRCCVTLKKLKSQGKAVEVTVNSNEDLVIKTETDEFMKEYGGVP
jgi:hypothetical protein